MAYEREQRARTCRTREELIMLQALPLEVKVAKTKLRIKEFVEEMEEENVYVSFSGGKDSTVLLDIVRSIYPNIKAVFADTGLEYPELKQFVKEKENIEIVRPEMTFRQVIETYGYPIISKSIALKIHRVHNKKSPGESAYMKYFNAVEKSKFNCEKYKPLINAPFKVSHMCCDEMKKNPLHKVNGFPIIATMTNESSVREKSWIKSGCNVFGKKPHSNPISFWSEQDVLNYIQDNNLEIASVYGEIIQCKEGLRCSECQRTGCVFCGFGAHMVKRAELSRFEMLKQTHPKLYNYCIYGGEFNKQGLWQPSKEGLGMGYVFEWCNENINNFEIRYK